MESLVKSGCCGIFRGLIHGCYTTLLAAFLNFRSLFAPTSFAFFRHVSLSLQQAFTHNYRNFSSKTWGVISYHPALHELLLSSPRTVEAWGLPMVIPPQPWLTSNSGGYLLHKTRMVRTHGEGSRYVKSADRQGNLVGVLQALDVLGATAWRINEPVLKVAIEMWNKGEQAKGLPAPLKLPPKPRPTTGDKKLIAEWYKSEEVRKATMLNNLAQRVDSNYKLDIAKAVSFC
ncbi:hypothetical protein BDK51DRAFT_21516 [Blyttiomyces helicus]|uniref:DNA-directed RNA polymerase N-terminal domain-containing protein n=1 Tax=Blyttiomyces helicus TaxID=388810 RepID=A0A4P9WFV7_9FUNG|nr:hypothetical protein BDK51DRAFT_21516 [Blyttiomyces helicus]|eukprot:RKO90765.1 hypothetical protein BDK51DRAFT_21516 [Blyttiomyces helicus]